MNKRKKTHRTTSAGALAPCLWARRFDALDTGVCSRCPRAAGYLLQVRCAVHDHGFSLLLCDLHLPVALEIATS